MKKLFALAIVAGMAFASCTPKNQEEPVVESEGTEVEAPETQTVNADMPVDDAEVTETPAE